MGTRRLVILIGAAMFALGAFVIVWFEPQALFIDDRVDEPPPAQVVAADRSTPSPGPDDATTATTSFPQPTPTTTTTAGPTATTTSPGRSTTTTASPPPTTTTSSVQPATTTTAATTSAIVAEGPFRGVKGHRVDGGTAQLYRFGDGSHVLRIDELDAQNGPDLHVYLSSAPADGDSDAHDDDYVALGKLKGNVGSSNYEIPDGVDLERYGTAVIWCERFSVGFAVAPLDD